MKLFSWLSHDVFRMEPATSRSTQPDLPPPPQSLPEWLAWLAFATMQGIQMGHVSSGGWVPDKRM